MPTKIKKPFYKRVWFWILVVIVIFLAIGANGSKTNNSTSSKAQTSKTKSKPKYAEVNKDLAKALKKDQSYANDDPTNFGYAKYIESIKYTGGSDITVNVNGAFKDVDNDVKTDVMNQTQNLAKKEHSEQIDTLESLGILRRSYGISNESEKDDLSKIEQLVDSMDLKQKLNGKFNINLNSANNHIFITKHQYDNYEFIPGSLELTNLGKSFARIVLL